MTMEVTNIQRMRVDTEAAGSFCTDGTGTLGNFRDVAFMEGTAQLTLTQNMLSPAYAQQYLDGHPTKVLGTRAAKLTFKHVLTPSGTGAASGVTHPTNALSEILGVVMGGVSYGIGDDVQASPAPTKTTMTVADASTNQITAGSVIGFPTGVHGLELREVESVSTNAVVLKLELLNTPSAGNDVSGCATHYLTSDPDTSLQFILQGAETSDQWVLFGGQLESMSLELPIGQLPTVTFSFMFADWMTAVEAAMSEAALAAATYSSTAAIHTIGELLYQTVGTVTLPTALPISSIKYNLNFKYAPVSSPSGTNGVYRWRRIRSAPAVSGQFTLPVGWDDSSNESVYMLARDNKTLKGLWYQLGYTVGNCLLISCPTIQIVDYQVGDAGGIKSQIVSFESQLDQDVGSSVTDKALSAFRIAMG